MIYLYTKMTNTVRLVNIHYLTLATKTLMRIFKIYSPVNFKHTIQY